MNSIIGGGYAEVLLAGFSSQVSHIEPHVQYIFYVSTVHITTL